MVAYVLSSVNDHKLMAMNEEEKEEEDGSRYYIIYNPDILISYYMPQL